MCSQHQQSRKPLASDLHLPRDRVHVLRKGAVKEWASPCPSYLQIKGSGGRGRDDSLLGAIVGLGAHAEPLQPLPASAAGNVQDLKSCETSSGMSQLSGAHRPVTERTPLLLFIEACQMGKKRKSLHVAGGAEFLSTCFQVQYTEGKKKIMWSKCG